MTLDLTKKTILLVGSLSLLAIVIIFGIAVPMLRSIKKTSDESYRLRVLLEQKYEQSLRSHITRKKLEEIKNSTASFYPYLFKSGDDLRLITFLEALSAKHKINQTITNSTLDKIGNGNTISISINLSGTYNNALKYIAELESADYFIYISQLQFSPTYNRAGEAASDTNLNMTLELYVNR